MPGKQTAVVRTSAGFRCRSQRWHIVTQEEQPWDGSKVAAHSEDAKKKRRENRKRFTLHLDYLDVVPFFNMRMQLAPFYLNTGASLEKKKKKCLASFCECQICSSFSSQAGIQNDTHQNVTHELCIHAYRECRNERNGEIKEPTDANTVLLKAHTGSRVPRHNGNVTTGFVEFKIPAVVVLLSKKLLDSMVLGWNQ